MSLGPKPDRAACGILAQVSAPHEHRMQWSWYSVVSGLGSGISTTWWRQYFPAVWSGGGVRTSPHCSHDSGNTGITSLACSVGIKLRWTPLSRQNLNFFKVEKYTSALGQCPWFPAPGYGYPCTGGTGFGTRGLDEGVFHCRI